MEITVPGAVRTYITASNAFDADAVMDGNYDRTGLPDPLPQRVAERGEPAGGRLRAADDVNQDEANTARGTSPAPSWKYLGGSVATGRTSTAADSLAPRLSSRAVP
jgi:hypothetical protein